MIIYYSLILSAEYNNCFLRTSSLLAVHPQEDCSKPQGILIPHKPAMLLGSYNTSITPSPNIEDLSLSPNFIAVHGVEGPIIKSTFIETFFKIIND